MSLSEKAKTTCFIHNEMYYKNASPDEKWVRLSDHQQEIDCLKDCLRKSGSTTLLLSKDLQKCERERDLQKQKLQQFEEFLVAWTENDMKGYIYDYGKKNAHYYPSQDLDLVLDFFFGLRELLRK